MNTSIGREGGYADVYDAVGPLFSNVELALLVVSVIYILWFIWDYRRG